MTFNAMMGALQEDDKYASYNTPMDGEPAPNYYPFDGCKVPATTDIGFQDWEDSHDFSCCQANLARGLAQVSEWAVLTDRSAMYLNFYGSSAAQTKTPAGKEIVLSQSTQYPIEGAVRIEISSLEQAEQFTLALRIPSWSLLNSITVNGEEMTGIVPGEYYRIDRTWKEGDVIQLQLDLSVHFWEGDVRYEDKTSIYYGPVLLAADERVSGAGAQNEIFTAKALQSAKVSSGAENDCWLYVDVPVSESKTVRLIDFSSAGHKIGDRYGNYYSWLNVAEDLPVRVYRTGEMPVWVSFAEYSVQTDFVNCRGEAEQTVRAGETVQLSFDKALKSFRIVAQNGAEVSYLEKDGVYSFTMPAQDIRIEAVVSYYTGNIAVQGENATALLQGLSADEGQKVTFEVFVKEGFELSSVKVESANGQIEYVKEGDTYTFEMPASDVTVHVQAKEQTKPENPGEQEQEGCSSSFAAASVLGACALLGGAAALLRKKKRD